MKAISIIELLLVITLVLIIGASSAVFLSRFISQAAVIDTQAFISRQIRKAQLYAMEGKQNSEWGVRYGTNNLTLFKGSTYAGRDTAFDENYTINPVVTVTWLTEIVFSKPSGVTTTGTDYSITILSGNNSKIVTVNSQGVSSDL